MYIVLSTYRERSQRDRDYFYTLRHFVYTIDHDNVPVKHQLIHLLVRYIDNITTVLVAFGIR